MKAAPVSFSSTSKLKFFSKRTFFFFSGRLNYYPNEEEEEILVFFIGSVRAREEVQLAD